MSKQNPTPEKVLAFIIDEHRHASCIDPEVNPGAVLSFNSTVADWRLACDLLGWQSLGHALNETWGIDLPDVEWESVLEPPQTRTLRGLCELIARNATIDRVPSFGLLGGRCSENRAFWAIRSVLLSLGVPRKDIRPETRLTPLLSRYGYKLLNPCIKLAPGALPCVVHTGIACRLVRRLAYLVLLAGIIAGFPYGLWGLAGFAVLFGAGYVIPIPFFRGWFEIPGIVTLRELAEKIGEVDIQSRTEDEQSGAIYSAKIPQD